MNILVTGATGFIGKNVLATLVSNIQHQYDKIIILSKDKVADFICINHNNYQFSIQDFIDQGIRSIDIVIHLGAFTPKTSAESNDIEKSVSNIVNTQYLINNLPSKPKKFIFTSTLDVYDNINGVIVEGTAAIPSSLYGQSKLFCEKMLEEWAIKNDVIIQILRLGHIYGNGEDAYQKIIPQTIRKVLQGDSPYIFSDGREKRSFIHVTDCCKLILKAIELCNYKKPINIVSNQKISILDLVEMIIEVAGCKVKPIIQNHTVKTRDLVFDNSKMEHYLGSESITLKDGLREEYEYFKSKYY